MSSLLVYKLVSLVGIFDRLCELLLLSPSVWIGLPPPFLVCISILVLCTVYTYTLYSVSGIWGHRRGEGLRQIKHLPQSPFTGQFFQITAFGITFYQSNLSTLRTQSCNAILFVQGETRPWSAFYIIQKNKSGNFFIKL